MELRHRPEPWVDQAACAPLVAPSFDPWHPESPRFGGDPLLMYAVARRICMHCPVRLECAQEGLRLLAEDGCAGCSVG